MQKFRVRGGREGAAPTPGRTCAAGEKKKEQKKKKF
jgi:hypothetical protein